MALDARHRSSIYGKLIPVLGEDDANALMSEFPSVEADELVTKQFLRAELAEFRSEIGDLRTDTVAEFGAVRREIAELRNETLTEFGAVRREIGDLRTDTVAEFGAVRREIADLRTDLTVRTLAAIGVATAVLGTLNVVA